jgi:RNA polymerase sigma factor (sigma-70 family)
MDSTMLRTALGAFLRAASDDDADAHLETLLGPDVDAVLRHAIRRVLGARADDALVADLQSDARLRLLTRLRQLRQDDAGNAGEAIDDFAAYAATIGFNVAYVWLRRKYPERTRLKNQLRYAIARDRRIRVEHDAQGRTCCSLARLRPAPPAGSVRALVDNPAEFAERRQIPARDRPLVSLVVDVLGHLDAPIDVDDLLDAVAVLVGIPRAPAERAAAAGEQTADIAAPAHDLDAQLDNRRALERIWREIGGLRPRQRAALLLNLREPGGGAALALLPLTGIASMRQIAAALEMSIDMLTSLWGELPLDDRQIADRLNATRQQVINLRKTARATLARRLAK